MDILGDGWSEVFIDHHVEELRQADVTEFGVVIGAVTREELDHQNTVRVDIAAFRVALAIEHLWRKVVWRSNSLGHVPGDAGFECAHTKVGQLEDTFGGHQDILRLDVTMNDGRVAMMQILKPSGNVESPLNLVVDGELRISFGREENLLKTTLHQLRDQSQFIGFR